MDADRDSPDHVCGMQMTVQPYQVLWRMQAKQFIDSMTRTREAVRTPPAGEMIEQVSLCVPLSDHRCREGRGRGVAASARCRASCTQPARLLQFIAQVRRWTPVSAAISTLADIKPRLVAVENQFRVFEVRC